MEFKMSKNDPAFPTPDTHNDSGLTKREYAAIHILAGLAEYGFQQIVREKVVQNAIVLADLLFEEFEK